MLASFGLERWPATYYLFGKAKEAQLPVQLEDYIPVLVVTVDIMANRGIPVQLALMGQAAPDVPPDPPPPPAPIRITRTTFVAPPMVKLPELVNSVDIAELLDCCATALSMA